MGIETAIILGLVALKASQQMKAGEQQAKQLNDLAQAQAKAGVKEGEFAAKNKAREVTLRAARLQSSFLTSGLTLEGTPGSAIQSTFSTGLEDVNQILSNTSQSSRNAVAQGRFQANAAFNRGRSEALGTLITGAAFAGSSFGGGSAAPSSESLLNAPVGSSPGFSISKV